MDNASSLSLALIADDFRFVRGDQRFEGVRRDLKWTIPQIRRVIKSTSVSTALRFAKLGFAHLVFLNIKFEYARNEVEAERLQRLTVHRRIPGAVSCTLKRRKLVVGARDGVDVL